MESESGTLVAIFVRAGCGLFFPDEGQLQCSHVGSIIPRTNPLLIRSVPFFTKPQLCHLSVFDFFDSFRQTTSICCRVL
jgi:hypothetical protein